MNKKRLAIAGIVLSSALLVVSTAFTVAWYDGSSHLGLSDINISFSSKSEVVISTDNEHFKDRLGQSDLNEVHRFAPITSAFSNVEDWLTKKEVKPTFLNSYYPKPKRQLMTSEYDLTVASSGYLSQDLYFLSSTEATITLDKEETFIQANHEKNVAQAKELKKNNQEYSSLDEEEIVRRLDSVTNSLRLSILVLNDTGSEINPEEYKYTIIDPHKDGVTRFGGLLDGDGNGFYDSYNGKEVLFGQCESTDSLDDHYQEASANDKLVENGNVFNAGTQAGVRHLDVEAAINAGDLTIAEENSISLSDVEENFKFSIHSDVSKKIVLSLYQEGWDKDNTDFARYSHFNMNLSWKMLSVSAH